MAAAAVHGRCVAGTLLVLIACALSAFGSTAADGKTSAARFGGQRIDASPYADRKVEEALLASGIDRIAVQNDGVVTSLRTFAEIHIDLVADRSALRGQNPVYTLLAMIYRADEWHGAPIVPVASARLSRALGLDPRTQARISLDWALADEKASGLLGDAEEGRITDRTLLQPLEKLRGRLLTLKTLPDELKIVPLAGAGDAWISVAELRHDALHPGGRQTALDTTQGAPAAALALDDALRALFEQGESGGLAGAVESMLKATHAVPGSMAPWAVSLDRFHTLAKPFHQSARLFLLAAILALFAMAAHRHARAGEAAGSLPGAGKAWIAAMAVLVLAEAALVAGLVILGLLTARMPVANMYESLLFTLAAFGLAGIVFEARSRTGWLGCLAAFVQWLMLTFVNNLPVHMTRRAPLIAVLDSLWLNFHVTTVMVSYGLFLLGFLFCVLYLFKDLTGNRQGLLPDKDVFERLNYRCIQIGWPLLGIGIFLGAVWANTAWGSYWSWDPKETWSLITWLAYALYLHLRMNAGWSGRRSILASMAGFLMVLITYFGVSYLPWLAGGLHSYA